MIEPNNLTELPKGWVWTSLKNIACSVKGKKPLILGAEDKILNVPYINIEAFEHKIFTQFTNSTNFPRCNPDDILIVWDGARCGLVGKGVSGVVGSTLAKLNLYKTDSLYIYYFIKSKFGIINSKPKGVGIPHLDPSIFWNLYFPLPPLPEQHRIVNKIEELFTRLDAGVEALKKIQLQLKRYRQSVLKAAFEGQLTAEWREAHKSELEPASALLEHIKAERKKKLGSKYKDLPPVDTSELPELPEGWGWASLAQISWDSGYGTSEKCAYKSTGYPVLRIPNIVNNKINLIDLKFTKSNLQLDDREQLSIGDLLVIRTNGSKDLLGRTALVTQTFNKPHFFASYLIRYRLMDVGCLPIWVNTVFIGHRVRRWIEQKAATSAGQNNISMSTLDKLSIEIPPLREQYKIIEEIQRQFSIADEIEQTIERSLKESERLRQSILKQAFEGKLVPQDPIDEPAEKLLERIKAEKAKLESKGKVRIKGSSL